MFKVPLRIFFLNESFHCYKYLPERNEKNKKNEFFTSTFSMLKKFIKHIETNHKWKCVVNTNQDLKFLSSPTQITLDSLNLP